MDGLEFGQKMNDLVSAMWLLDNPGKDLPMCGVHDEFPQGQTYADLAHAALKVLDTQERDSDGKDNRLPTASTV